MHQRSTSASAKPMNPPSDGVLVFAARFAGARTPAKAAPERLRKLRKVRGYVWSAAAGDGVDEQADCGARHAAVRGGHTIELTLVENCELADLVARERWWIAYADRPWAGHLGKLTA